jgi:hypothetical protein
MGSRSQTPDHLHAAPQSEQVGGITGSRFNEEWDASMRGSSVLDNGLKRTDSTFSATHPHPLTPSRGGTLKKKPSLGRRNSLKRSGSRRSSRAGSVRSMVLGEKERYGDGSSDDTNSAFTTPVPTSGNPTEILASRFQGVCIYALWCCGVC